MAKKPTPILTHTEILCYAIRHLEAHVNKWRAAYMDVPDAEELVSHVCEPELAKIEALKTMYRIETGTEY